MFKKNLFIAFNAIILLTQHAKNYFANAGRYC